MDDVRKSAPVFLGALLGIYLLVAGVAFVGATMFLGAMAVCGILLASVARSQLGKKPVSAVRFWQLGMLLPISIISATTFVATFISFELPEWLKMLPDWAIDRVWITDKSSELAKILVGILNAFLAALWLDNAKNPTSKFWPSGQMKVAFEEEFRKKIGDLKEKKNDKFVDLENAVSGDQVRDSSSQQGSVIEGWNYSSVVGRAHIIQRIIASV